MKVIYNIDDEPQHPYLIPIPEGYQYCHDCDLLTPHTLDNQINPSKAIPSDFKCDICDSDKMGYDNCPMCGWEHDPDRDLMPVSIKVKKHTTVCLEKQKKEWDEKIYPEADFMVNDDNCNCPEVDAYPIQKIFNYSSRPQHWNMECSDAKEWSYDIMCPICNYVFEVEDGNC